HVGHRCPPRARHRPDRVGGVGLGRLGPAPFCAGAGVVVMVCPGCGRSRQRGTVGVRCSCIPEAVWSEPEMVSALERLDVAAVVRLLRFHPSCQGLTLLALSRSDVSRAVQVVVGLGAPGPAGGHVWVLPEGFTSGTPPPLPDPLPSGTDPDPGEVAPPPTVAEARAVVITSPVPAQVHTAAPDPAGLGRGSVAALAADPEGLSVVVASGTTWSVDSHPGYSTVRITLPPD